MPNPIVYIMNKINERRIKASAAALAKMEAYSDGYHGGAQRYYGQHYQGGLAHKPDLNIDTEMMCRQIRSLEQESPETSSLINREVETVVGDGLMVTPEPQASILGITADEAKEKSQEIYKRFDLWASSKSATLSKQFNFYQIQELVYRNFVRDGEFFVVLYYSQDKELLNPLQISVIDRDQIRNSAFIASYQNIIFDDGIIRNERGEETGYKVWRRIPGSLMPEVKDIPAKSGGRLRCLHGYKPIYAGQGRGIPELGRAIQTLSDITKFKTSEIQKALNQASISIFVKPSASNPAGNPFQDLLGRQQTWAAIQSQQTSGDSSGDGEAAASTGEAVTYKEIPNAVIDKPSIGVFNLQEGEDLKPFQATAPSNGYKDFVDSVIGFIASDLGMSAEAVTMRFNTSYSAARAALVLMYRNIAKKRLFLASYFIFPIYEMWLSEEISAERLSLPGWLDPIMRAAWLRAHVSGLPMPDIDPLKTLQAGKMATEMGAVTLKQFAMEYNGSDFDTNVLELQKEAPELPKMSWQQETETIKVSEKGKLDDRSTTEKKALDNVE